MRSRGLAKGVVALSALGLGALFSGCFVDGSGDDAAAEDTASSEQAVYTCPSTFTKSSTEQGATCTFLSNLVLEQAMCDGYCGGYCTGTLSQKCKDLPGTGIFKRQLICSCAPAFDCADGVQSGGETDVDCGGPCGTCATGQGCMMASDCQSGVCNAGVCLAPSCSDGILNGNEQVVDCGGSCGPCGHLVINEVDYDQISIDTNEYIEIYNPTPLPVSLAQKSIVLVNGANNLTYTVVDLSPAGSLAPGGYLVIASPTVAVAAGASVLLFAGTTDQVQNGAPDGIALVDNSTGTLIDALSYEGSMTAANVTGIAGTVNLVEGSAMGFSDSNTVTRAIVRSPNGQDTDDASVDWSQTAVLTPGSANP